MTGVHVVNVEGTLHKNILDKDGNVLKEIEVTGKPEQQRDQDVVYQRTIEALGKKQGCRMTGSVKIHKVPGNFHISCHKNPEAF